MIKVISPHLDDGILSLGQMLAAESDTHTEIVTVFAGLPGSGVISDYDRSCGFTSSTAAMEARHAEDVDACAAVGAHPVHLPFLDRQYRPERTAEELAEITQTLHGLWGHAAIFAPLGVGHPDHEVVAKCALAACPDSRGMYVYEELPYRVLHPEQVADRLFAIQFSGFAMNDIVSPILQGDRAIKAEAIGCYGSQFPDGATDPCLLVPERAWRIARS